MRRKKLPNNKHKGLLIYCNRCYHHYSWTQKSDGHKKIEPKCGESKAKLSNCKFHEKHRFKVRAHVPGSDKGSVSKILSAKKYEEAVLQAINFQQDFIAEIKGSEFDSHESIQFNYLLNVQVAYLDFLCNINVPDHQKVSRTEKHIKEQKKCLLLFNESLELNKINKRLITIEKVSDDHVGFFHTFLLENKKYKNKTYNNKMGSLKGFYEWAIKKYSLKKDNPFENTKRRSVVISKDTINRDEFYALLNQISQENGIITVNEKNRSYQKNLYRPYLKDAIELALHTGGRREEVTNLKWNMIVNIDDQPSYIAVNNLKIERQKGEGFNENVAPKIIPITEELLQILLRLGYYENKDKDEFIICPDRTNMSTNTLMDVVSKGFSHFYKQLNTGRELHFKCLRKTYLTYLDIAVKGNAKSLSSHTSDDILQKHYIDEKVVSTAIKEMSIFSS